MLVRSLRSVSMSRTWGMFSRMTSSSVRMAAAMQGRAEFFAPETLMVPRRGLPPRTTNLSIKSVYGDFAWKWVAGVVPGGWIREGQRVHGVIVQTGIGDFGKEALQRDATNSFGCTGFWGTNSPQVRSI